MSSRTSRLLHALACVFATTHAWAAVQTVTQAADSGPGSLRATIALASPGDVIRFDLRTPATIHVATPISITKDLTIQGLGARSLTLDGGYNLTPPAFPSGTPDHRIFDIQTGATAVTISGLHFAHGYETGASNSGGPDGANGAAIRIAATAAVTLDACTFEANFADIAPYDVPVGGAVYNNQGTLTITNSSFFSNEAGAGSAVYNAAGNATLTNCTFNANASLFGGPIFQAGTGTTTKLVHCTVTDNVSLDDSGSGGPSVLEGTLELVNTLLSGSSVDVNRLYGDLDGSWIALGSGTGRFLSDGGNVASSQGTLTVFTASQDKVLAATGLDAFDATLAKGGQTPTRPILTTSPAIGNALPLNPALTTDQRWYSRPGLPDTGAYQFDGAGTTFTLTGTVGAGTPVQVAIFDWATHTALTDNSGAFTFQVPNHWSGVVAPLTSDYTYTPTDIPLDDLTADTSGVAFTRVLNPPTANAATNQTTTAFTANWNSNPSATGYYLDVAIDALFTAFVPGFQNKDVGDVTAFQVTGLPPSTAFYYRVTARDNSQSSVPSNTVSTTTADRTLSTTQVIPPPSPSAWNQTLTFSATVTSGATGTVTFKDGTTTLGQVPLNNGTATFTTASLAPGNHTIQALYGGDANFLPSSTSWIQVVDPAPSTTTLSSTLLSSQYGQSVGLTATVTSGATGTVTFKDGAATLGAVTLTSGPATLTVSNLSVGTHANLTASYSGDANYQASTGTTSLTVSPCATGIAFTSTSGTTSYGQTVTVAIQVSNAYAASGYTGTATILDGGTSLATIPIQGDGSGQFTTSTLAVGTHALAATYSGDTHFQAATTTQNFTQTVTAASTTTAVTSSNASSSFGQAVTFTATVTPAVPGTVSFTDNGVSLGVPVALNNGVATLTTSTLAAGGHTIVASYAATSNYQASTSSALSQTVGKATVLPTLAPAPGTVIFNQSVTFTATVAPGATGAITFQDGTTTLGVGQLQSQGTASFATAALAAGSHSIIAVYGGDANYANATSAALPFTVNKAPSTAALTATPNSSTFGQNVTLTAAITGGTSGTVTFLDGSATLGTGTLSGGTATLATSALTPGPHTLTASFGGDANFGAVTSPGLAITVGKGSGTLALGGLSATYDGTAKAVTVTTTPTGLAYTVTYNGSNAAPSGAGTYAVLATLNDPNYAGTANGSLTIAKGDPGLAWASPAAITLGTPLSATQLDATAKAPGTFVYTPPAGTVLGAGPGQPLSVAFTPSDAANYNAASMAVTLDVGSAPQTITFGALSPMVMGAPTLTLTATASSNLPVTFTSSNGTIARITGNVLSLVGPGTCTITASQAGNGAFAAAPDVTQTLVVTASATPPVLQVSTLSQGSITPSLLLNVAGQATSLNQLQSLTLNGVNVPLDANGAFSGAVLTKEGSNTITVIATDTTGLTSQDTRQITLDVTAPVLTLTTPADNMVTSKATLAFTGSLDLGLSQETPTTVTYALNGALPLQAHLAGTAFDGSVTLAPGLNTLELIGTTSGGRTVHEKRSITLAPGFTLAVDASPEDLLTDQATLDLQGLVADNTSAVTLAISLDGQVLTPLVVGGAFQQALAFPTSKPYALTIAATDQAGTTVTVHRNILKVKALVPAAYTMADATRALGIASGLITPTADDLARFDLAPLVDGVPAGDGVIGLDDAMIILDLASGLGL